MAGSINRSSVDVVFERHGKRNAVGLMLGIGIAVIVLLEASGNIGPYQIDRILMEVRARAVAPRI